MANPRVFLNEGYIKQDGTSTVYVLVHHLGETLKFPTGVSCIPKNFNKRTGRLKGINPKASDFNLIIEASLARVNDIFVRYRLQNEHLTPELLKKEWNNPTRRIDFYMFLDEAIKERQGDIADSSIKQHLVLLAKLKEFRPKLSFSEIDHDFIESFRRWLKTTKKNDLNTIHNNLKNFKAYMEKPDKLTTSYRSKLTIKTGVN